MIAGIEVKITPPRKLTMPRNALSLADEFLTLVGASSCPVESIRQVTICNRRSKIEIEQES
jgi:hypothetical protein